MPDVLGNVGDSHKVFQTTPTPFRTGFGTDCSGLIAEAAKLAGWSGTLGLAGDGWGSGAWATESDHMKDVPLPFLRPGDIIAYKGHVLFVNEDPTLGKDPTTGRPFIKYVPTLEASPDRTDKAGQKSRTGAYLGRTRVYYKTKLDLDQQSGIVYRRLLQP